jgi:hypothetical protein
MAMSRMPVAQLLLALLTLTRAVPTGAQAPCDPTSQYTYSFQNECRYPIWIGARSTADPASHPPQGGNWAVAAACATNADCRSGTCDQDSGQCVCTTGNDCTGGATCLPSGKCSTSVTFCMPQTWKSGTFWPRTGCTLDAEATPATLTCETGACARTGTDQWLLDCSPSNEGGSPTNPVTQFEVTSSPTAVNYDVSIAAGFNVETSATPVGGGWVEPGTPSTDVAACLAAGCTADLNATCPTGLKVTSGTTTIGCLDPCTQCARNPGTLQCSTALTDTWTSCSAEIGPVTYEDLYCAKNTVDGNPQASPNQGTATAFGPLDCFPGTSFVIPTFGSGYALPPGQGVCLYTSPPQATTPHFNDYGWADAASGTKKNCGGTAPSYADVLPDGTPCGGYATLQSDGAAGYPSALGYTCRTASYQDADGTPATAHLCMPPTTSGLGQCTLDDSSSAPLYGGGGGVANPAWLAAGLVAGGGSVPYYATFKQACPGAYAWQYDDLSSGFGCNPTLTAGGETFAGFSVTFCGSRAPSQPPVMPAGTVVALEAAGKAERLGAPRPIGRVRVRGRFTAPDGMALDETALSGLNVLDESGGAGELVRGANALALTERGRNRRRRIFETSPGVKPHVRVLLEAGRGRRKSQMKVAIVVARAELGRPEHCSGGRGPTTSLETSFVLQAGSARPVLVGAMLPWQCRKKALVRRE